MLLLYLIAIMSVYTYAPIQKIDSQVLIVHFSMAIISPIGNLARALFVSLNVFQISCHGDVISKKPGDIRLYGGPIVYLLMQSFVLFGILLWYDSGSFLPKWFRKTVRVRSRDDEDITDPDILREIQNVRNSTRGLRVLNVTKAFGSNVAVEDVTFGIGSGEVFALLGPNGAGKSTVISLIRGDIRPQKGGDILAENISVIMRRALARSHLGVCPQFDAMDQMTVLEHLRFYARIRGVTNVEYNVKEVVRAVGLQAFSNKMASKLSGGNKRKLSLGIALMGTSSFYYFSNQGADDD
jgi:ABC-type transport system involved in cytochrome c biogenesis ATPase subunit